MTKKDQGKVLENIATNLFVGTEVSSYFLLLSIVKVLCLLLQELFYGCGWFLLFGRH